nr:unnamed protein product [Callosobruchus chinensis]
MRAQCA